MVVLYYCNKFLHSSANPLGVVTDRETQMLQMIDTRSQIVFLQVWYRDRLPPQLSPCNVFTWPSPWTLCYCNVHYMASSIQGAGPVHSFISQRTWRERKKKFTWGIIYKFFFFFHWKFPFSYKNLPKLEKKWFEIIFLIIVL